MLPSLPWKPWPVYKVWPSASSPKQNLMRYTAITNLMCLQPQSPCDPGAAAAGYQARAKTAARGDSTGNPVVGNVGDQLAVRHLSSADEDATELFDFLIADHMSWNLKCKVAPAVPRGHLGDSGAGALMCVVPSSAGLTGQGLRSAAKEVPLGDTLELLQSAGDARPGGHKRHRASANSGALVVARPAMEVEPVRSLVYPDVPGVPGVPGVPAMGVPENGPSSKVDHAQRRPPASPCTVAHPLCRHSCISFNLALTRGGEVAKPGKVLQHCAGIIESKVSDQLTVFKIGITVNPVDRWCNTGFGYCREGFTSMQLLHCERNSRACGFLEAALIAKFRGTLGCQNEAPGGEGFSTQGDCETMCYLYAVFKGLSRTAPERSPLVATAVKSRCKPPPQR